MPCYNSAATLAEALDSVLSQECRGTFELIAVDDCSGDETSKMLKRKATADSHLKIITHEENRGGGAARNTGIGASTGRFVLVFDSDDVLCHGALQAMYGFLSAHEELDGALFEEQRTFTGTDKRRHQAFRFYTETKAIELRAIFQGKKALIGNFLFRRTAFERAGPYPEHHGFDTQAFCMRFLSKGLHAQVAPGACFWHRVSGPAASYFERVFAAGRFSLNTYLIYEDLIEMFSGAAIDCIMDADVFRSSSFGEASLSARMEALERAGIAVISDRNDAKHNRKHKGFVAAVQSLREQEYEEALRQLVELAGQGFMSPVLHFNMIRCTLGLAGRPWAGIIEESLEAIQKMRIRKIPSTRGWGVFWRGLVKFARIILTSRGFEDPIF
jgi:glycosyltransferase involved in cell wall biosynthesis